jgi:hypothetical protein
VSSPRRIPEDLRGIDARMRTRKKLTAAVQAAGTSLTGLFAVVYPDPARAASPLY